MKATTKKRIKKILFIMLGFLALLVFSGMCYLLILDSTLSLNNNLLTGLSTPLQVYNANDQPLGIDSTLGTPFVNIQDLPPYTPQAFISIEDNSFYAHHGLNYKRIVAAMWKNLSSGKVKEGASTISQQLIKNTHLSFDRTFDRKVKEMLLTKKLEKKYSKQEIIELYLNAIYFGNGCYGIESAANFYFGKNATELSVSESALLAAIINSPKRYSPIEQKENALKRRNLILKKMKEYRYISLQQYEQCINEELSLTLKNTSNIQNYAYINACSYEASHILDIPENALALHGFKIYTYYDKEKQSALNDLSLSSTKTHQNALILDNKTGGVQAFISSLRYGASTLRRSPASTIKPIIVYAPAIEAGKLSPASFINDERSDFNGYSPRNIHDKYYGEISAREALALSLNVPAVRILNELGIENAKNFAKKLGIPFEKNDTGLALALGGFSRGVSISELCSAYSAFTQNGTRAAAKFIKKIENRDGRVIYTNPETHHTCMSDSTAYLTADMLRTCATKGTCKALKNLPFEVIAKSGTAGGPVGDNNTDVISIACTSENTACIWYFSPTNKIEDTITPEKSVQLAPTSKLKGVLEKIYKTHTPAALPVPESVEELQISVYEYEENHAIKRVHEEVPDRYKIKEKFAKAHLPKEMSTLFEFPSPITLEGNRTEEGLELRFAALPFMEYHIYRIEKGSKEPQSVALVNNKRGAYTFLDTNALYNTSYCYYVVGTLKTKPDKTQTSNTVTLIFPSPSTKLLEQEIYKQKAEKAQWFFQIK